MQPRVSWGSEHSRLWHGWQERTRVERVYDYLRRLPRRIRRALQRQWKQSLAGVAVILALGAGETRAATITVTTNVPNVNLLDFQCSLIEAMHNANKNLLGLNYLERFSVAFSLMPALTLGPSPVLTGEGSAVAQGEGWLQAIENCSRLCPRDPQRRGHDCVSA